MDSLRDGARTACAETIEPVSEVRPFRHKDADGVAEDKCRQPDGAGLCERRCVFVLDLASRYCHAYSLFARCPGRFDARARSRNGSHVGLCSDSMVDWAAARVPFLQREVPP